VLFLLSQQHRIWVSTIRRGNIKHIQDFLNVMINHLTGPKKMSKRFPFLLANGASRGLVENLIHSFPHREINVKDFPKKYFDFHGRSKVKEN